LITYQNIFNPLENGTLPAHQIPLNPTGNIYNGFINTSQLSEGNYRINVSATYSGFNIQSSFFNLTLNPKYTVNIIPDAPAEVTAGDDFILTLNVTYYNGTNYIPIANKLVSITPIFDGIPSTGLSPQLTNSQGIVSFQITVGRDVQEMNITFQITEAFNYEAKSFEITTITVNPAPGLSFEDILPYLLIGLAVLAAVGVSVGAYRKVILPKKQEKQRVLKEVKTMFEDAVNMEHLLVLYKGSGTCFFFRSFGSEKIDPDLISGFISAVSSFGKEVESQKALNEIRYGDKMLLLADGEYIRVALVL
jgi:hypothetical protein